ncbi:MAG: FkbM family methyltransferase [Candidatus Azotimanducaceae bacterium]|jgi:FkbM family methyltransferase
MDIKQKKYLEKNLAPDDFKSQKRQDRWVLFTVLPDTTNGFFLDLAAADGLTNSNTHVLEKCFDWSGLCIEPNPVFYEQLGRNRKCKTTPTVVSDKEELIQFRIDNGQLGGVIANDTDNSELVRGDELAKATILSLHAKTINQILMENDAPKVIDYFSLDIEGSEERVISTLDFDTYQFKCLTIERPTEKVNEILFDNGYIFVKNFRFDSHYVHPDVLRETNIVCDPFEQVPRKDW